MRVAVADIGTNSTRLLIADVGPHADGAPLHEVERRSTVTRLGEGVNGSGRLSAPARERVHTVLDDYAALIAARGARRVVAVMTSAVRDAADGPAFAAAVADRHGLEARILSGDEEAHATFAGATATTAIAGPLLVVDIGGGSTELVVGRAGRVDFHVSTQIGVVRHGERHLPDDPPTAAQLEALRREVHAAIEAAVPAPVRASVRAAIAVAGTPTSAAGMDLAAAGRDPAAVEGHVVAYATIARQLADLAAMDPAARRTLAGLHPERAPTIVPGLAILLEVLDAFRLGAVTVSDRDILWGTALTLASAPEPLDVQGERRAAAD